MGNNELVSNFKHFDRDGNGRIDFGEFSELLDALGAGMSEADKRIGFEAIDTNGNQAIEFDEFESWWNER